MVLTSLLVMQETKDVVALIGFFSVAQFVIHCVGSSLSPNEKEKENIVMYLLF